MKLTVAAPIRRFPRAARHRLGAVIRPVLLTLTALTVVVLSLSGSAAAAHAETKTVSGTISAQSPTFNRLNPPCSATSVNTHYRVVRATLTGTDAAQLTIKVTPTDFRAHITVYQEIFLPDQPVANCWGAVVGSAVGASVEYSSPLVELLPGFTKQTFLVVVAGNSATDLGSFTTEVTVSEREVELSLDPQPNTDTTPPVLALPGSITEEATGPDGAAVSYTATAQDAVDGAITPTCAPASGSTFALGVTTVNCAATDAAGNRARGSFTVTVEDTTPPELPLPSMIIAEATGAAGATVAYPGAAWDDVDGEVSPFCTPASGSVFPIGTTSVDCVATDAAGNSSTRLLSVVVTDTTAPALDLPDDLTEEATGPDGAAVTFTATAQDVADGEVAPTCTPDSGSTFPLGDTTVNCEATDTTGNTSSGSFTITVANTTAPVLNLPDDLTKEATSADGATATFTATAQDAVDGAITPTCTPASGGAFPIGETTVDCTVTDAAGNSATGSFTVSVVDTTAPTLDLPDAIDDEATSADGASVDYPAAAHDTVDGAVTPSCAPASGSVFPVGDTTVTCTAVDAAGSTATGEFVVTIAPFQDPDEDPDDSDDDPTDSDDDQSDDEPGGRLPKTGSSPAVGLSAASVLLLAGGAMVAWSRRRAS